MAPDDVRQEDPLQAVVLCDVFTQRFAPLTLDQPRCLMPVCNVPLIEWTLESLATAGVHEVFLLATWHIGQIRAYMEKHYPLLFRPQGSRSQGMTSTALTRITLIPVPEARSVGDTMRELDAHQVIKSDFVLVQSDALGNMDIASVVRAHKQRRTVDRDAIMTICAMPVPPQSRARRPGDLSVFTIVPTTSQLVHYMSVPAIPRVPLLKLPFEVFEDTRHLDVRNDLVDCGVDVCSIDVPPLFTENFDYQQLRREFVQGILSSDLLESKIFVHITPPAGSSSTSSGEPFSAVSGGVLGTPPYGAGYMLRISDPSRYDAVSRDVLAGWTYPYTPRLGMPDGTKYASLPGSRFYGDRVATASTAAIGHRTLLGAHTRVDEHTIVSESVLGHRVSVGPSSAVRNSYLWDDVAIGRNCVIDGCILGRGVLILDHVHLTHGTMVGDGCVIGPDASLPAFSRVSMHGYRACEDDSDTEAADADADTTLGKASRGCLWPPITTRSASADEDEDEDERDELERPCNAKLFMIRPDTSDVVLSDAMSDLSSIDADTEPDLNSESEDEDDSDTSSPNSWSAYGSMSLTLPDGTNSLTYGEKRETQERLNEFRQEARASLERAFEEKHAPDNAAIELKTLRMASNVPPGEVRRMVVSFLLGRCAVDKAKETADLLDHWGPLLQEVAQDDQVEALALIQSYCAVHVTHTRLFLPLLKKVYNDELVSDESILAWWKHPSSRRVVYEDHDTEDAHQIVLELRKRAEPVVRHILEDDDDDDDDDE